MRRPSRAVSCVLAGRGHTAYSDTVTTPRRFAAFALEPSITSFLGTSTKAVKFRFHDTSTTTGLHAVARSDTYFYASARSRPTPVPPAPGYVHLATMTGT